jgi:hypothetical protein
METMPIARIIRRRLIEAIDIHYVNLNFINSPVSVSLLEFLLINYSASNA